MWWREGSRGCGEERGVAGSVVEGGVAWGVVEGGVTGGVVRREHREKNVRHKPHTTHLFSTHVQIRAPVRTQCATCSCYSTFPPSTTP